jgi:hypothetical protein
MVYLFPSYSFIIVQFVFNRDKSVSGESEGRKSVKFADGVRPGEGTSPSAGEDLPSPPPPPRKLPKEKRFKKKKKKKIKVMVCLKICTYYWYSVGIWKPYMETLSHRSGRSSSKFAGW